MRNSHDKGDLVRVRAAFTTRDLTAAERRTFADTGTLPDTVGEDPGTVRFKFRKPDGTLTTYTHPADGQLVRQEAGSFYVLLNANAVEIWAYRYESEGAGQAAEEGEFIVTSRF